MTDSPEILRVIERAPLFQSVPRETLQSLITKSKRVTLIPGDRLLSLGKINEQVYIIISGRLSVKVSLSALDEPIAMLAPGDCVGEMSVLVDGLASAFVVATTHCELLAIDYISFWGLINDSSEVARNMLKILVQRIHLGNEIMANSILHQVGFPDKDVIDNLTGLYNYHGMHKKFDRLLKRAAVDKRSLCLIVLEVDEQATSHDEDEEFRTEQTLHAIARTILTFMRPDDHAARLIGKKFAVLLTNISIEDAVVAAERLRASVSEAPILLPDGHTLQPVTISAGVSEALPDDTWGAFVARSDTLLEHAVSEGRDRVAHTQPVAG